MASIRCGNCKGTHSSVSEVRSCYGVQDVTFGRTPDELTLGESLRELEANDPAVASAANDYRQTVATLTAPKVQVREIPHDGYFTVVMDTERRTLRFKTGKGNWEGKVIVSYLAGPDNESDYIGFGHIVGGSFRAWKRVQPGNVVLAALAHLVGDPEAAANAGEAYALESSRCCRCNRTLTVPASIHRGMGPECANKSF